MLKEFGGRIRTPYRLKQIHTQCLLQHHSQANAFCTIQVAAINQKADNGLNAFLSLPVTSHYSSCSCNNLAPHVPRRGKGLGGEAQTWAGWGSATSDRNITSSNMSANRSDQDCMLLVSTIKCNSLSTKPAECIGDRSVKMIWQQNYRQVDD
jgi:hypothetical protein